MKYFIFIAFFSLSAAANVCPELQGKYHCMLPGERYSLLKITQQNISEAPELVEYTVDYEGLAGDPDVFEANTQGLPDSFGYIVKCASNRLLSMPIDGSSLSEMYLDQEKAFVLVNNGVTSYKCPRKISQD